MLFDPCFSPLYHILLFQQTIFTLYTQQHLTDFQYSAQYVKVYDYESVIKLFALTVGHCCYCIRLQLKCDPVMLDLDNINRRITLWLLKPCTNRAIWVWRMCACSLFTRPIWIQQMDSVCAVAMFGSMICWDFIYLGSSYGS